MHDPSIDLQRNAESARYALLRRLAPALRHQLAGGFQPVTMMAAIIEKRLRTSAPDLPSLIKTSGDLRTSTTDAARANLDLMGWIAPDAQTRVPLSQGIEDAVHLLATDLSFRGFRLVNQTAGIGAQVAQSQIRGLLVAGLLALSDEASKPGHLMITAGRDGEHIAVTATLTQPCKTDNGLAQQQEFASNRASYRKMSWDDVAAIANADGVTLKHTATSVGLRLPILFV